MEEAKSSNNHISLSGAEDQVANATEIQNNASLVTNQKIESHVVSTLALVNGKFNVANLLISKSADSKVIVFSSPAAAVEFFQKLHVLDTKTNNVIDVSVSNIAATNLFGLPSLCPPVSQLALLPDKSTYTDRKKLAVSRQGILGVGDKRDNEGKNNSKTEETSRGRDAFAERHNSKMFGEIHESKNEKEPKRGESKRENKCEKDESKHESERDNRIDENDTNRDENKGGSNIGRDESKDENITGKYGSKDVNDTERDERKNGNGAERDKSQDENETERDESKYGNNTARERRKDENDTKRYESKDEISFGKDENKGEHETKRDENKTKSSPETKETKYSNESGGMGCIGKRERDKYVSECFVGKENIEKKTEINESFIVMNEYDGKKVDGKKKSRVRKFQSGISRFFHRLCVCGGQTSKGDV